MPIRFLDMFAGIGGFRSGLERLGGFECVGYCEIDKYAKQAYDAIYPTEGAIPNSVQTLNCRANRAK